MKELKDYLKYNTPFFIGFELFLIIGAIILFFIEQGDAIKYLNQHHNSITNFYFKYGTQIVEEPVYVILTLVCLIFVRIRYAIIFPILGGILLYASHALKAFFAYPRPIDYFTQLGTFDQFNLVEGVTLLNGLTSFPSGHTMSAFALYGLIALFFKKSKLITSLCFIAALTGGLSRVYLVQHFFMDVYAGAMIGVFIALVVYYVQSFVPYRPNQWWDKSLIDFIK